MSNQRYIRIKRDFLNKVGNKNMMKKGDVFTVVDELLAHYRVIGIDGEDKVRKSQNGTSYEFISEDEYVKERMGDDDES